MGIGAGVAVGGTGAGAPGVDVSIIDTSTSATIGTGAWVDAADDVSVTATAKEKMLLVSAGVAVGGTVGLALTGTIFATRLTDELPRQLAASGVPAEVGGALAGGGGLDRITGVGDLGAAILAATPEAARGAVQPFIPAIVSGIHDAVSIATSATFTLGIGAAAVAAGLVLLLREAPAEAAQSIGARAPENGVTPASS
jgi:hypothetical protein